MWCFLGFLRTVLRIAVLPRKKPESLWENYSMSKKIVKNNNNLAF